MYVPLDPRITSLRPTNGSYIPSSETSMIIIPPYYGSKPRLPRRCGSNEKPRNVLNVMREPKKLLKSDSVGSWVGDDGEAVNAEMMESHPDRLIPAQLRNVDDLLLWMIGVVVATMMQRNLGPSVDTTLVGVMIMRT